MIVQSLSSPLLVDEPTDDAVPPSVAQWRGLTHEIGEVMCELGDGHDEVHDDGRVLQRLSRPSWCGVRT